MTIPFRDPVIYPGTPLVRAPGRWVRLRDRHRCAIGGEVMNLGTVAQWRDSATQWLEGEWVCRDHAHPEWAEDTP